MKYIQQNYFLLEQLQQNWQLKGQLLRYQVKFEQYKEEKNIEKIRSTYDEIINELLSEREEAVRIAQAYKSELEKVVISDEDIQHLHNTVSRILEIIKNLKYHLLNKSVPKLLRL